MAKQSVPAWIEKSVLLYEGKSEPEVSYNFSINDSNSIELSYEQLMIIRDMIDKITK